jgi:hypothetical protein
MPRLGVISKLRTRRVPHFAGAYAAGCWIVLEVLSQLVDMQVLPPMLYQLGLVLVVTLAPGVLVVAWFHGEKGAQEAPLREKWLLAGIA